MHDTMIALPTWQHAAGWVGSLAVPILIGTRKGGEGWVQAAGAELWLPAHCQEHCSQSLLKQEVVLAVSC